MRVEGWLALQTGRGLTRNGMEGVPESQVEEFEVRPVNLRELPKAFSTFIRVNTFYED